MQIVHFHREPQRAAHTAAESLSAATPARPHLIKATGWGQNHEEETRRTLGELGGSLRRDDWLSGHRNRHALSVDHRELDDAAELIDRRGRRPERNVVKAKRPASYARQYGGNDGPLRWPAAQSRRDLVLAARIDRDADEDLFVSDIPVDREHHVHVRRGYRKPRHQNACPL